MASFRFGLGQECAAESTEQLHRNTSWPHMHTIGLYTKDCLLLLDLSLKSPSVLVPMFSRTLSKKMERDVTKNSILKKNGLEYNPLCTVEKLCDVLPS